MTCDCGLQQRQQSAAQIIGPAIRPCHTTGLFEFIDHDDRVANPYDGHTLGAALEQVEILTERLPELVVVDRGYRGHGVDKTQVLISGTRRGLTPALAADLRRRAAIEPEIGHMKTDGRLARSPLKGTIGDALFAVL